MLLAAGALTLSAAGCGDDEEAPAAGDAPPAATTSAPKPTGAPIKLHFISGYKIPQGGINRDWDPKVVDARVRAINASGGINGRPVELTACNVALDANLATKCARAAVADKAAAVIGLLSVTGPEVLKIVGAAGIPVIGGLPNTPQEAAAENAFPLTSGFLGVGSGLAKLLPKLGSRKVGYVYAGVSGQTALFTRPFDASLVSTGAEKGPQVAVATDQADLAPAGAAATASGVDGVAVNLPEPQTLGFVKALKATGADQRVKLGVGVGALGKASLEALGESGVEGIGTVNLVRPISSGVPGIKQYVADLKAAGMDPIQDDNDINYWAATWLFERIAKDLDDVTGPTVLEALSKAKDIDLGGLVPPLDFTKRSTALPGAPRLVNPTVVLTKYEGGELKELDPGDPFVESFR